MEATVKKVAHLDNREPYIILPLNGATPSIFVSDTLVPIRKKDDWVSFIDDLSVEVEDTGQGDDESVDLPAAEVNMLLLIHSAKKKPPPKIRKRKKSDDEVEEVDGCSSLRRATVTIAPPEPEAEADDIIIDNIMIHCLKHIIMDTKGMHSTDTTPICVVRLNWEIFISTCVSF